MNYRMKLRGRLFQSIDGAITEAKKLLKEQAEVQSVEKEDRKPLSSLQLAAKTNAYGLPKT